MTEQPTPTGSPATTPAEEPETFETRRWRTRTVRVFAAMDTMEQITERVLAVVGEGRVMNKISTYVHAGGLSDLSNLRHATGLRKGGHAGYPAGHHVWHHGDRTGFSVYLTHEHGSSHGTMESFGVGVSAFNGATEQQVRARHDLGRDPQSVHAERRDITYLWIHGRPGDPHREDRIEVMYWNEHGVLEHTIVTFVEPDYCDSGRLEETNYVVVGHRKSADGSRPRLDQEPETFATFVPGPDQASRDTSLSSAKEAADDVKKWDDVNYAWVAEERVVRERRSVW